jgi:hypothetical protein
MRSSKKTLENLYKRIWSEVPSIKCYSSLLPGRMGETTCDSYKIKTPFDIDTLLR